jgi:PAS domain S-box-containing protein
MQSRPKTILVVEDEFITAADLIAHLETLGFQVPAHTGSGDEVYSLALLHKPDLIVMDINLKGNKNGIEAADEIKNLLDIPVVFLTGQSDEATILKAIASEPFGYIVKPFEDRTLKTTIAMSLYKHSIDQRLKASETRYRRIAEGSDHLILIISHDLTIEYANQAGSAMIGTSPEKLAGQGLSEVISPDDFPDVHACVLSALDESSAVRNRIRLHLSGNEYWFDATFTAIPGPDDTMQVLWIARDISDLVQIQKAIEIEGIQQIEKNMEQFQILNDQIRNPLTIIASIVSEMEIPEAETIQEQVKKIDDLVTRLDKGWIESNKVRAFLMRHFRHGIML